MRLLFVVQRYGHEVAGGAEQHCREFATRLAARGHHVEVATSCARNYQDWANWYPEGESELDGVTVHRLRVERPRDPVLFSSLDQRTVGGHKPVPLHLQREWMRLQGPFIPALSGWLEAQAGRFDVVIAFTYLYFTTWAGLSAAAAVAPTVLHPTAHDEPPLYLSLFDLMFRLPRAFAVSTEEEAALVRRRFHVRRPTSVIGIGVDLSAGGDAGAFRVAHGLGDRPYLVYVGRVDPNKGADELYDHFVAYKRRNHGPLALVVVGEPVKPLPPDPDVFVTGFVAEPVKRAAIEGALALVQPSYFESFSMVLTEAWAHRKPAIVQGRCEVLRGQARRSGGGLPYEGFAEFEAAVDLLVGDPALRGELGENGRRFVEERYDWDTVLTHYERFLTRTATLLST